MVITKLANRKNFDNKIRADTLNPYNESPKHFKMNYQNHFKNIFKFFTGYLILDLKVSL